MGIPSSSQSPSSVVNQGQGILWNNPANAAAMGAGTATPIIVTDFSITNNVATFTTPIQINPLIAGQTVVLSQFQAGTYFNNQTVTVLSSGLTLTSFQINFTHADVGSTTDSGVTTPTTQFASAALYPYITLSAGQNVMYVRPNGPEPAPQYKNGTFSGSLWSLVTMLRSLYGVEGSNFSIDGFTATSSTVPIPALPFGAAVVGIYPCATGVVHGTSSSQIIFSANWTNLEASPPAAASYTFALNGTFESSGSIGTNLAILPTMTFNNYSAANNGSGPYWDVIQDFCVAVVYTLPTGAAPIPPQRLQSLTATQFNFTLSSFTVATGVLASFSTGTNPVVVTNFSISGNVATFTTETPVVVGQSLTLTNFQTGTYFNNQTVTVLSGATATSFTANFTHANVGSTPDAGYAAPITAALTAQLTLNGRPIGQPKPVTLSSWTSMYTLGGDGDLWGTVAGDLTDKTINGTDGLGINFTGTLPGGSQININNVQLQVFTIFQLMLPSFALIATYSTSGDTPLAPTATLRSVPNISYIPNIPVTLLYTTSGVAQVQNTYNNGTDPAYDSGLVATNPNGNGSVFLANGVSVTTVFTLRSYDSLGSLLLTNTAQLLMTQYKFLDVVTNSPYQFTVTNGALSIDPASSGTALYELELIDTGTGLVIALEVINNAAETIPLSGVPISPLIDTVTGTTYMLEVSNQEFQLVPTNLPGSTGITILDTVTSIPYVLNVRNGAFSTSLFGAYQLNLVDVSTSANYQLQITNQEFDLIPLGGTTPTSGVAASPIVDSATGLVYILVVNEGAFELQETSGTGGFGISMLDTATNMPYLLTVSNEAFSLVPNPAGTVYERDIVDIATGAPYQLQIINSSLELVPVSGVRLNGIGLVDTATGQQYQLVVSNAALNLLSRP